MVEFQKVLEYLRDRDQPGQQLTFPPTGTHTLRMELISIARSLAEQLEANRKALEEMAKHVREQKLIEEAKREAAGYHESPYDLSVGKKGFRR